MLIVLAGFGAGCLLTKRLSFRLEFFEKFSVFLSVLKTQIRYSGDDIFKLVSRSAKGADLEYLCGEADYSIPFSVFWEKQINNIPKSSGLNNSDKELLIEFGSALGSTDIEGQLKHIELYQKMFAAKLDESKTELQKKSAVYKALGLFGGISVAIIIL